MKGIAKAIELPKNPKAAKRVVWNKGEVCLCRKQMCYKKDFLIEGANACSQLRSRNVTYAIDVPRPPGPPVWWWRTKGSIHLCKMGGAYATKKGKGDSFDTNAFVQKTKFTQKKS